MILSEISIRRPVFAWMLMSALIIFGAICFSRMGVSQLPDVDFPVVSINIRLEGAAPEVIETQVVDFVEDAVMGIEGVHTVSSRSENGEGTITVEFDINRSLDLAVQDVQAKLSQIQSRLPREITATTVTKTNPEDQPIMLITLESDKFPLRDLMYYVNDRLKGQISMISGVGDISLGGYIDPNLRIWIKPSLLKKFELSVTDIIKAIQNEHIEQPAGKLNDQSGNHMFFVRTMGEATTIEQFNNIIIENRGGQPNYQNIKLSKVARIEDGVADILRYSRAMGTQGVGLGILKVRGANAVGVAKAIRKKITEIQKVLPEGMRIGINYDSTLYIEQSVNELLFTLILSALLTSFVCWIFLGSWSSTFNVLLSIPTSIIGTFIYLYFAGFTLNSFTLLGLSLSIGIVVDDAIMVLENIIRHQEMGKDKVQAAIDGSNEIAFAAIAASIAIIAIFLPVIFMKGVIGKFFFQFGLTMTVAVLLSLVEAVTITPMRCSQFVDSHGKRTRIGRLADKGFESVEKFYKLSLAWTLRHPWKVTIVSIVLCLASYSTLNFLNKEFLPSEDQSRFAVRLKTPIGSSLDYSNQKFAEVETFMAQQKEVDRYVLQVGGGSLGDANLGSVLVTMKDKGHRGINPNYGHELSQREFMDYCRQEFKKIKDLRSSIQDLSTKGFSASRGFPVEFTVQGPEWKPLAQYAQQIATELEKTGLVTDIDLNYESAMPEIRVVPDRIKAAAQGVSVLAISDTVNSMIGGTLVGRYPKGGHRYDIRVKLEETADDPAHKINQLFVRNNHNELVSLASVVTVEQDRSMSEINRLNRERAVTVYANVKTGQSQKNALDAVEELSKKILPLQYHTVLSGSSQTFNESFQSLIIALVMGLIVSYMVLASQFNSFSDPLVVLLALPFSVSGALVALLLAHQSINIYSMIGLILLMGIAKKNSILLVDFTNKIKNEEKLSISEAILKACPIRLRPITMTSLATLAGAIPAALALGPGAESRIPMAIGVIGGVLVSTLLTLYVVPSVYYLIHHRKK